MTESLRKPLFCKIIPELMVHTPTIATWVSIEDRNLPSVSGLHKLWYPGIWDMSTWSKFGAHGEHGDVFLFSNLGAL